LTHQTITKNKMKTFTIENTAANYNWVLDNLDDRDYTIVHNQIIIKYRYEFQMSDILNAIA
jgi:hypothetical protein